MIGWRRPGFSAGRKGRISRPPARAFIPSLTADEPVFWMIAGSKGGSTLSVKPWTSARSCSNSSLCLLSRSQSRVSPRRGAKTAVVCAPVRLRTEDPVVEGHEATDRVVLRLGDVRRPWAGFKVGWVGGGGGGSGSWTSLSPHTSLAGVIRLRTSILVL